MAASCLGDQPLQAVGATVAWRVTGAPRRQPTKSFPANGWTPATWPAPTRTATSGLFCRDRVGYKAPDEIVLLDTMPLNPTGKIDRPALKRIAEYHLHPHGLDAAA
jgi:hypothetical protein